jgi:outer membrane protein assembly factor BamA
MAQAAQLVFLREGRLDASVRPHAIVERGRVDVCIQATPGPKVTIAKLAFVGRSGLPEAELLAAMKSGSRFNRVGGIYDADAFGVDLLYVSNHYWDAGFATVKVGEPRVTRHGNTVSIEVPITEGVRFRYGRIRTTRSVAMAMPLERGQIFSRTKIQEVRDQLQKISGATEVIPKTKVDLETATIDIEFEFEDPK